MRMLKHNRLSRHNKTQTWTFLALEPMCNESSSQPFAVFCFFSVENIDAKSCAKMPYMYFFT